MPGPSPQERPKRYRERLAAEATAAKPAAKVVYPRAADRRSKPQRWADAVAELISLLDDYQNWRDSLPASLRDTGLADRLDEVLALRDLVDQLDAAELPKGFGRD